MMRFILLFLFFISCEQVGAARTPLKIVQTIALPGPLGKRFDYLTTDIQGHRMFSAHLGADQMYVIDLKTNAVLKTVAGLPGIEGIEYASDLEKIYTSNWKDKSIAVVDAKTFEIKKKLPGLAKPDGSVYAQDFQKLYVSDEVGKAEIVIDAKTDAITKILRFDSETGMPQYDSGLKKIYVNLQDQNVVAVIDPVRDEVVESISLKTCSGNHGMALDAAHHLAFIACEGNDKIVVLNLQSKQVVFESVVPPGVDVVKFDAGNGYVYAACYSGAISIIQELTPTSFKKLGDYKVERAVHSLGVDPETHRIYVPEQQENEDSASKMVVYEAP